MLKILLGAVSLGTASEIFAPQNSRLLQSTATCDSTCQASIDTAMA